MMRVGLIGKLTQILLSVLVFASSQIVAQERCFSPENTQKIIKSIESPQKKIAENKKLHTELLKMVKTQEDANRKAVENWETDKKFDAEAKQIGRKNALRLCGILSENGWLTKESIGDEGFQAI